jgi:hypothetical protein
LGNRQGKEEGYRQEGGKEKMKKQEKAARRYEAEKVKRTESEDLRNKENRGGRKYKTKRTRRLGKDE